VPLFSDPFIHCPFPKRGRKFVGKKEGGFMAVAKEKPKVVFVCVENARRSQMAEGFAEAFGQGKIEVYSAGSRPSPQIDPLVIEVMKEKGIDLSARQPKGLNDLPPIEMDYLVTMGCEETCPAVLAKRIIEWEIPDPKGKSIEFYRQIRDTIKDKVKALLEDID
jgi:protein-tyrosine-phosphatase